MVRVTFAAATLSLLLAAGAGAGAPASARKATATPAAPGPTVVVSGRGWGHGVGMSQYGALGFAREGWTYDRILAHYYPGTELGPAPLAQVRVLLAEGRKSLKVSSPVAFAVKDGAGTRHQLEAGAYSFGPGLRLKLKLGEGAPQALPGPLLFSPGVRPLAVGGKDYRGSIRVDVLEGRLRAINVVGLEPYLAGVVPDEVPPSWPAEALRAQAVVARSYALAVRRTGGDFDLYPDTRSQVYGGVTSEEPETTAAVGETAGQVLLHEGKVATTFFYSTSGGRTAAISDVWDGAKPTPYLVSVEDPHDSLSPYHTWGPVELAGAKVQKALGVKGTLVDARTTLNDSGRVATLTLAGTKGETTVPAATVRLRLGLRSTWFTIGLLGLDKPKRPATFGAKTRLTGVARNLEGVTLERRLLGSAAWETVGELAAGEVVWPLRAEASAEYRLAAAQARSAIVRVLVAPGLKLLPPSAPTALAGVVRPILPGTTVAIQRKGDARWETVATAPVGEDGAFEATLDVAPGAYRARIAPGRGWAVGFSPVLRVE